MQAGLWPACSKRRLDQPRLKAGMNAWFGVGVPRNTPTEIVDKLNQEINAGLADAKFKARFAELGAPVFPGSPADFGKLIVAETEKWAKVIKFAGIKAE
jgi:tripartite-type tricarboxylate transporter receptor subunit TctC